MSTYSRPPHRRGFTLIEMAIIFTIAGVVLSAIWVAASIAREAQKNDDAVTQLQTVVHNVTVSRQTMGQWGVFTGAFPANITSTLISAGAIPRAYVNTTTPTTANTPWKASVFLVWQIAAKTFRISFYLPTFRGCMELLLKGTACDTAEPECPTGVYTKSGTYSLWPTSSTNWLSYTAGLGWKNMTPAQATAACNENTVNPSVEFDYVF